MDLKNGKGCLKIKQNDHERSMNILQQKFQEKTQTKIILENEEAK